MKQLKWRKSSRSAPQSGDCVEAAATSTDFRVRDSKLGEDSPVFRLSDADFTSLLRQARQS